jgi:hypothetical protein
VQLNPVAVGRGIYEVFAISLKTGYPTSSVGRDLCRETFCFPAPTHEGMREVDTRLRVLSFPGLSGMYLKIPSSIATAWPNWRADAFPLALSTRRTA